MSVSWVKFLGTSAGTPTPESWFPSILVFHSGIYALLDAGEGAQIRLLENGVGPARLDVIAITHMHGDHLYGLPGLIQSMAMSSRSRELVILGPRRLGEFLRSVFKLSEFEPGFPLRVKTPPQTLEVRKGGARLLIEPFNVCHYSESYGYKVTGFLRAGSMVERTRFTLAYTGDTRPCEDYLENIRGVDVLIHDSTFSYKEHGESVWEYGHSTAHDAGKVALTAGAGLLVLFHKSVRYKDSGWKLLEEAKKIFENTILAEDGMTLYL